MSETINQNINSIPHKTKRQKKKYTIIKDITRNPFSYLLALPAMAYTFIFGYLTLPYMLIAFQRFNYKTGLLNSQWVGFKNFEFFFKSPRAFQVTWNTVKLNFLFILIGAVVAVFLAIMLNEVKHRMFLKVNQSFFLFPHFLSWVVVSYIIYGLFSTEYGFINNMLKSIGMERVEWYSRPDPWTWILVGMRIWKGVGMQTVIYLAAITGIDGEYYEAAIIDGASRWQQISRITIPLMMPTVIILTLLALGKIFYGDFAMIYSIIRDNGLLYPTTDVIDTYVFRALRRVGDPSQAMAVGLYQAIMGFILVCGSNWIARKFFKEGALF